MPISIGSNSGLLGALSGLRQINDRIGISQARLVSAQRINSARDDAAGLAISTRFESAVNGRTQAIRNAGDGVSLAQTAEGALGSISSALQRIGELSLQSANGSLTDTDRAALQAESSGLVAEINDIVENSNFNGVSLLSEQKTLNFAVGGNGEGVDLQTQDLSSFLDSINSIDLGTQTGATSAIATVQAANDTISEQRVSFGALQGRFESAIDSLEISRVNESEALSRVRDTDFAAEVTKLARDLILEKSTIATIAQANANNKNVLGLLS